MVFFQKITLFQLESEFSMFLAFFELHNISFAQNFQIFIFLAIKFPSMTNFIPKPLATKIVIKEGCFWYLWNAKDKNIYLKVHF